MAVSPTVRRMQLTRQLRELREACAQTIDEVASQIGISKSTLSRVENGQVAIKLPVLRILLQHYGVDETRQRELELLNREASQRGWWQSSDNLARPAVQTLAGLEAEASGVEDFSIQVLNGLLQTRQYSTALIRGVRYDAPPDEIEALVNFRMRRAERLPELKVWTIIAEESLNRPIGGKEVMREQVSHLRKLIDAGLILQLLSPESGQHPGLDGPFSVMTIGGAQEFHAVYVEANGWDACIEDQDRVLPYRRCFDRLRAKARSPEDSELRLEQLERDYSR